MLPNFVCNSYGLHYPGFDTRPGQKIFPSKRPDRLRYPLSLLFNVYRDFLPTRVERSQCEAVHSPVVLKLRISGALALISLYFIVVGRYYISSFVTFKVLILFYQWQIVENNAPIFFSTNLIIETIRFNYAFMRMLCYLHVTCLHDYCIHIQMSMQNFCSMQMECTEIAFNPSKNSGNYMYHLL
jgi:hypothetical protein